MIKSLYYKILNFRLFYRMARSGIAKGRSRRAAISAVLSMCYGIRLKHFWRVNTLIKYLKACKRVTPDRSRWWVFRMWWRYV